MGEKYRKLEAHLAQVHNLTITYRILSWDQQVNMPPGRQRRPRKPNSDGLALASRTVRQR